MLPVLGQWFFMARGMTDMAAAKGGTLLVFGLR
jgi:hypothetical protein